MRFGGGGEGADEELFSGLAGIGRRVLSTFFHWNLSVCPGVWGLVGHIDGCVALGKLAPLSGSGLEEDGLGGFRNSSNPLASDT